MDAIKEAILSENNRDSLFDFNVLKRNLRKRTASDDFISALRQSKGLRFLLLANFHDAYLISFQKDIVYGKDALEFLIDFSGTFRLFKETVRICKIRFIGAETEFDFEEVSDFGTKVFILGECLEEKGETFRMTFEIYVAKADRGYEDEIVIEFKQADVWDCSKRRKSQRRK